MDNNELFKFERCQEGYRIKRCSKKVTGKIIIPSEYEGLPVVAIAGGAFEGCYRIESIHIPSTITSISKSAFVICEFSEKYSQLKEIQVDEKNPVYDSRCNCNAIIETETNRLIRGAANTIIPSTVKRIVSNSFNGLEYLYTLVIPRGVKYIDSYAFTNCINLKELFLPLGIAFDNEMYRWNMPFYSNCPNMTLYFEDDSSVESEFPYDWNEEDCPVVWNYKNNNAISNEPINKVFKISFKDGEFEPQEIEKYLNSIIKADYLHHRLYEKENFKFHVEYYDSWDELYNRMQDINEFDCSSVPQLKSAKNYGDLFLRLQKAKNTILYKNIDGSIQTDRWFCDFFDNQKIPEKLNVSFKKIENNSSNNELLDFDLIDCGNDGHYDVTYHFLLFKVSNLNFNDWIAVFSITVGRPIDVIVYFNYNGNIWALTKVTTMD